MCHRLCWGTNWGTTKKFRHISWPQGTQVQAWGQDPRPPTLPSPAYPPIFTSEDNRVEATVNTVLAVSNEQK